MEQEVWLLALYISILRGSQNNLSVFWLFKFRGRWPMYLMEGCRWIWSMTGKHPRFNSDIGEKPTQPGGKTRRVKVAVVVVVVVVSCSLFPWLFVSCPRYLNSHGS
jgi:hypothetical protein